MSHLYGKFVWFEHMSGDTAAARKFYDALFGWHTEAVPMGGPEPYPLIMNGSDGIGGFRSALAGAPAMWMSYLSVRDVNVSHAAALAAGGTENGAPGLRPHYHAHYYGAFVLDPDGNNIEAVCHAPA